MAIRVLEVFSGIMTEACLLVYKVFEWNVTMLQKYGFFFKLQEDMNIILTSYKYIYVLH